MTRARDLAKLIAGSSTLGGTGELVLKDVDTADGSSPKITFQTGDTDIAADDVLGTIDFQAPDEGTGTDALLVAAGIEAVSEGDFSASSNATKLSFKTGASETATEKMTIKSDGKVGIGTAAPVRNFHLHEAASSTPIVFAMSTDGTGATTGDGFNISIDGSSGAVNLIQRENAAMQFYTNGGTNERMRIDSSGRLLIGKTSTAFSTAGHRLDANGNVEHIRSGGAPLNLNRKSSDGDIAVFYKDGSTVGSIKNSGTNLILTASSDVRIINVNGDGFRTGTASGALAMICIKNNADSDAQGDIGMASLRFNDIFASNGTIQTSDKNEKQDIALLTSAEITAATAISKLFKTFKWKDAVAAKGDNARTHTGVVAQQVQTAMSDAGLDASKYAFWCSDTWWEKDIEVAAVEAVDEVKDENGNVTTEAVEAQDAYTRTDQYYTKDEAPEGATERTRLGVRYPELLAFIGAATEQRLTSIEARLDALES